MIKIKNSIMHNFTFNTEFLKNSYIKHSVVFDAYVIKSTISDTTIFQRSYIYESNLSNCVVYPYINVLNIDLYDSIIFAFTRTTEYDEIYLVYSKNDKKCYICGNKICSIDINDINLCQNEVILRSYKQLIKAMLVNYSAINENYGDYVYFNSLTGLDHRVKRKQSLLENKNFQMVNDYEMN